MPNLTHELMEAIKNQDKTKVVDLINQKADVNAQSDGHTPLQFAALNYNVDLCRILHQAGAKLSLHEAEQILNKVDSIFYSIGNTAASIAATISFILIEVGIMPQKISRNFLYLAAKADDAKLAQRLLQINGIFDPNDTNPLSYAASSSGAAVASLLIGRNANPALLSSTNGVQLIHNAASVNNLAFVRYFDQCL